MRVHVDRRRWAGGRLIGCRASRSIIALGAVFWLVGPEIANVAAQSPIRRMFEVVERPAVRLAQSETDQPFTDDAQKAALEGSDQWSQQGPAQGDALKWGARSTDSGAPASATPAQEPRVERLPPPQIEGRLPLAGWDAADNLHLSQNAAGLITLRVRDASLSRVLALLAQTQGLNVVASNDIDALISITLTDVPLEEALTAILSVANYTWVRKNDIILITSLTDSANLPADVQGRQIQVFELDFASAVRVAEAVTGFLSPIGKVFISETDPADNRLTRELVVVEDLPVSLARIAMYICQVDKPPRQVLLEAHILQVNLNDETRCGVDFHSLLRIAGSNVNILSTPSLASAHPPTFGNAASGVGIGLPDQIGAPAFLATFTSSDLQAVIEALQTTTDSKTLGSPKLLVLNEQEARLQVGDQLSFRVTTTTETSSLESVQFLDVGVVLRMTPRITRDGRVLLHVEPEVSTGEVNPESGLPEKSTTELQTDVMLADGEGMVIGGLIKETDSVTQTKVPYLGDVKGLGWLFRRSERTKERVEIIVALVPRIQPYDAEWQAFEQGELVRAGVPLFEGPLHRTDRPWDPILPDGKRVYRPLIPRKGHHGGRPYHWTGPDYVVPPYPLPQQQFYGAPCEPMFEHEISEQGFPFLSDETLPEPQADAAAARELDITTDAE